MLRQGGLVECEEIVGVKKKVEGGPIRQPTLRRDQIRQDQSIFVAQKWEPIVNTSKKEMKNRIYLRCTKVGMKVRLLKMKGI